MLVDNETLIGQITPTVYINRIMLESLSQNEGLSVTLNLVLKDKLNAKFKSTWFGNRDLRSLITIKVIQITDKDIHGYLSFRDENHATREAMRMESYGDHVVVKKLSIPDFDPSENRIDNDGNIIADFNHRLTFNINDVNPETLSYYVFSYIDADAFTNMFGDIDIMNFENMNGKMISEIVFENSKLVSEASVLLDKNNVIWPGPIHRMSVPSAREEELAGPRFMTGFKHTGRSKDLTLRRVPNTKIQDFRIFRQQIFESVDLSKAEVSPVQTVTKILKNNRVDPVNKESYFTNAWTSRAENNDSKFLFGIDMLALIKDKAKFGTLINNPAEDIQNRIIKLSKIKSIRIDRKRIHNVPSINRLGSFDIPNQRFDDIHESDKLIAITGEKNQGNILPIESENGSLRELELTTPMNSSNYSCRYFSVSDRQLKDTTHGLYQYGATILVEDGSIPFLNEVLQNLKRNKASLEQYLEFGQRPSDPPYYIFTLQQFSDSFLQLAKSRWPEDKSTPWVKPIVEYIYALKVLVGGLDRETETSHTNLILAAINPATGNVEGISAFITAYDKIITAIQDLLGATTSLRSGQAVLNYETQGEKKSYIDGSVKYPAFIKHEHWFDNTSVDANDFSDSGISYMLPAMDLVQWDLRKISSNAFQLRRQQEEDKFITAGKEIPEVSHLSPNWIRVDGEERWSGNLTQNINVLRDTYGDSHNNILNKFGASLSKEEESLPIPLIYQSLTQINQELNIEPEEINSPITDKELKEQKHKRNLGLKIAQRMDINSSSIYATNWSLIQKIEVLMGYEMTSQGYKMVKAEKWEELTTALYSTIKGQFVLCRIMPFSDEQNNIKYNNNIKLPLYNKHFLVNVPTTENYRTPPDTRQIIESTLMNIIPSFSIPIDFVSSNIITTTVNTGPGIGSRAIEVEGVAPGSGKPRGGFGSGPGGYGSGRPG